MSEDVLSGGRIDQSTSGPNPPNRDDRDRDILLQQKERQDQDAIGGTQFPPRPQPLPPIPDAVEVAPSLPAIQSFDFNISGSALEETREIARQTVVDVLKNVTINGQGPSFEGSTIAFNIPQQPPASEAFIFQGIMVPQPLPQAQPIQLPAPPMVQPEPAQEIQSFVVSPPSRQQPSQETRIEPVQEPKIPEVASAPSVTSVVAPVTIAEPEIQAEPTETPKKEKPYSPNISQAPAPPPTISGETVQPPEQPTVEPTPQPINKTAPKEAVEPPPQEAPEPNPQPTAEPTVQPPQELTFPEPAQAPTTILESDAILPPTEVSIESFKPVDAKPKQPPKEGTTEERPQQEPQPQKSEDGEDKDFKPAYRGLSNYPTFEGGKEGDRSQQTRDETRAEGPDITIDRAQVIRDSARTEDSDITFEGAEEIRKEARTSTAATSAEEAESQAKDRRRERIESDSDFDRESPLRQKGETTRDFKERQEELKQERAEKTRQQEILQRAREGDISELPSGMIPVRFTRADGEKKILALMATEFVGTVEGAEFGERTANLPAEDSFYEGGGGDTPAHPWKITIRKIPESPQYEYAIEPASKLYEGFGGGEIEINGADGKFRDLELGFYFIEVDFNNGEIQQAGIKTGDEIGELFETEGDPPQQTKLRQQIGYVYLENNAPKIRQNAWQNYSLFQICSDSTPIQVTVAT